MNYNEWVDNQNNLFYELDQLNPNSVISDLDAETLNLMYSISHGKKQLSKSIETKTPKEIAKVIASMFMGKWMGLHHIMVHEIENPVGFESKIIFEETNMDATTKNLVTNQVNKVSAFNDEEMTDNTTSDDSIDETGNKQGNRQYTQTKTNAQSIDVQRKMLENNLVMSEIVCNDVSKFISLKIY